MREKYFRFRRIVEVVDPDDTLRRIVDNVPKLITGLTHGFSHHLLSACHDQSLIRTHWLRHTTLTWVERNYGYAVARAYAGHAEPGGPNGQTATYIRASIQEIADALTTMTGEPHPLANPFRASGACGDRPISAAPSNSGLSRSLLG